MGYLIDSSCFIQAQNAYYAIDICPGFWEWLDRENELGKVFSIQKVASEATTRNDEVAAWVRRKGAKFFLRPDKESGLLIPKISDWLVSYNANFTQASVAEFMNGADLELVAYALAHGHSVVTQETAVQVQPPPSEACGVKIPNVCKHFGVRPMSLFDALRATGAKFDLR